MGLDVTHLYLTLTPTDKNNFLYIDSWDLDCNVPLQHYEKFITDIEDWEFNNWIAIVDSEESLEKLRQSDSFIKTNYLTTFIGHNDERLQKEIANFVETNHLDKLRTEHLKVEEDGIKYRTIGFGDPTSFRGLYFDELGELWWGMNDKFYEIFLEELLWGKKEDFDLAYSCVGDEWYVEIWGEEAVNELRMRFKKEFVDKFEFGRSLLCVTR